MTGKIRGLGQTPGTVRIKGSAMRFYSPKYQRWVIRSWPKSNGGDTPKRAAARQRFVTATQVIKDAAPEMWEAADQWAEHSPYLARDILMACAMGTFVQGTMADGRTKVSLTQTNANIQQLLDSLGLQPGSLIARLPEAWTTLLPGNAGDVLTINGASGLPDWAPPSGGGSGGGNSFAWPQAIVGFTASSFATAATMFTPLYDIKLASCAVGMTTVAGATYKFAVYALDATYKITAPIGATAPIASPGAIANACVYQAFAAPLTLAAGVLHAVAIVRTDATATTSMTVAGSATGGICYPSAPFLLKAGQDTQIGSLASNNPVNGNVFTPVNGFRQIGMEYSK